MSPALDKIILASLELSAKIQPKMVPHFNRKMYDTTEGRYNTGVFIVIEPGYYQFTCALAAESNAQDIGYYLQRNRSTVATGLAK